MYMFWKKKSADTTSAHTGQIDFLAIGDTVTDAFIKLRDDYSWIENDGPEKVSELCMRFGDKIPYESVSVVAGVGNSPNAAVSAHRLGLRAALITNIGDDAFGKEQLAAFQKEGIDTRYVTVHKGLSSNYHYVLRRGAERTILVKHTAFPYTFPTIDPAPRAIYLSSLAENTLDYHQEIATYVRNHPETKLVFQPGTFQISLGAQVLAEIYKHTYLFFCNKEEAQRILATTENDIRILLSGIRALGPRIVVITDGPNGATVDDGSEVWHGSMYPDPKEPVDRTGAGDSFASTFTTALLLGKTPREALMWGPINSMSVVQYIGAQEGLLSREMLETYLADAPPEYTTQQL